jgi:hypothetical protein
MPARLARITRVGLVDLMIDYATRGGAGGAVSSHVTDSVASDRALDALLATALPTEASDSRATPAAARAHFTTFLQFHVSARILVDAPYLQGAVSYPSNRKRANPNRPANFHQPGPKQRLTRPQDGRPDGCLGFPPIFLTWREWSQDRTQFQRA